VKNTLDRFLSDCSRAAPFTMACFNIVGFKGYNDVLGHAEGDRAIERLQALMSRHMEPGSFVRARGDGWLARLPQLAAAESILDEFGSTLHRRAGWIARASRAGRIAAARETAGVIVRQRLRCLYAPVGHAFEVRGTATRLLERCVGFAPGPPVDVAGLAAMEGARWESVTREPVPRPYCPFCKGTQFDWIDGDTSRYGGEGRCVGCDAQVRFANAVEP
jgi:GGDEF domain-containing protein